MNFQFSDEEREILTSLIAREISELGSEIRHTATHEYRENLTAYRVRLRNLSERLTRSSQVSEFRAGINA